MTLKSASHEADSFKATSHWQPCWC